MNDLRILSHGKISDLSSGFSLGGSTFSICVIPKNATMDLGTTVNCQCVCDESASALPVAFWNWTAASIQKIPANGINLSNYDVYWGAGERVNS